MPSYDVVIAGGGIGGAVLGNLLGRRGKKVLIVEKNAGAPPLVRPEGLWPSTVKLLSSILNIAPDDSSLWLPMRGILLTQDQRPLLSVGPEAFEKSGALLRMTDPSVTRERLLALGNFELQRGVEVIGTLKEGARITGIRVKDVSKGTERDILAALTVGDDGVHSKIREGCGIDLKTRLFPVDFLCTAMNWPAALPPDRVRMFLNKQRNTAAFTAAAIIPLPGGKGVVLVPAEPRLFDDTAKAAEAWKQFKLSDPAIEAALGQLDFPNGLVRIRRPWGHAPRYGCEGAVLMGDALHPVSPAGGQGANMSVADAAALADVLLEGKPDFLAEYERRRRPANERSLNITRQAARAFALPSILIRPLVMLFLRWLNTHPDTLSRTLQVVSTRFEE